MYFKSAGLWLLASGVLRASATALPSRFSVDDARRDYWEWSKQHGLCRPRVEHGGASNLYDNKDRKMKLPGPGVLAEFKVCVAKNEFGEELEDTSGDIFCQGPAIHLMADAAYDPNSPADKKVDSKIFVDMSRNTSGTKLNNTLNGLIEGGYISATKFREEWNNSHVSNAEELILYNNTRFPRTPAFISRIRPRARILRAWIKIVHHKWNNLNRLMMPKQGGYLLPGPGSHNLKGSGAPENYITSAIRMEHPFVIAGGRFREQYYWDSFFIMEGLLAAKMSYLARTTLLNFMDQIKAYGFIPNGARKYYLNRSQPPLFIHMLHAYVNNTGDIHILHEALPLAERELRWWTKNRSVNVTVPLKDGKEAVHTVYQYRVNATGPRPESYAEDWRSAWCFGDEPPTVSEEKSLYSEFASGAESGWDYTARWMSDPFELPGDELHQMKKLEISRMVPVDLNSIIYRCHVSMAELYKLANSNEAPFAHLRSEAHKKKAKKLRRAIMALHWDSDRAAFFDYILDINFEQGKRKGHRKEFWSAASLAPYWSGIQLPEFACNETKSKDMVMNAFLGVRDLLNKYRGPLPATLVRSGQQWDFPNAWPPIQYIAIKALESVPQKCIEDTTVEHFINAPTPKGQLVLEPEKLPAQPGRSPEVNYHVSHSWRDSLVKTLVMRYMTSTFCSWNVTGRFPEDRAEMVDRDNPDRDPALKSHPGLMYEKLNATSRTRSGGGGEYEVQTGFGWTNGIAIWIAHQYGAILDDPNCPVENTPKHEDPSKGTLVLQG